MNTYYDLHSEENADRIIKLLHNSYGLDQGINQNYDDNNKTIEIEEETEDETDESEQHLISAFCSILTDIDEEAIEFISEVKKPIELLFVGTFIHLGIKNTNRYEWCDQHGIQTGLEEEIGFCCLYKNIYRRLMTMR